MGIKGRSTEELLEERGKIYGDIVSNHTRIAKVWSGITGKEITPLEVALMMVGLKAVRAGTTPQHSDNYDDMEGYASISRTIAEAANADTR